VNTEVWYSLSFYDKDWRICIPLLIGLAFLAGWYTREHSWGAFLVLLAPVMFVGSERHGRPGQWLISCFFLPLQYTPLLWVYFIYNMAPIIVADILLIAAGRLTRHNTETPWA
jgi:hypothetical protein